MVNRISDRETFTVGVMGVDQEHKHIPIVQKVCDELGIPVVNHPSDPWLPDADIPRFYEKISSPLLSDLAVEFQGIETSQVYPRVLPDLFKGSQLVLVGRYRGGGPVSVTLTGRTGREEKRFVLERRALAGGERAGFLPRLWARRHLDVLLAQGRSPETTAEIVAFSREHQIMTPYTSFLVLESDEGREAYGVERTVHMRDTERFFAEARDRAALEIARQQTTTARRYRLELRRQALARLANLGRDLPIPGRCTSPSDVFL